MQPDRTNISVSGMVVVHERDRRQRIRHLGLDVRNDEALVIDDTPMGDLLLDFVGERVLARGMVYRHEDGQRHIRVTTFSPHGEPTQLRHPAADARRTSGRGRLRP